MVWQAREALLADLNATVLKVTSLPARLPQLVAGFAQLAQSPGVTARCIAEPAGIATCSLATGLAEQLPALLDDLRARLRTHGGSAVVLQRGTLREPVDPWGGVPAAIDVMRAVKSEFDPMRILSPGRFVGGI